jgi:hypothetical protein
MNNYEALDLVLQRYKFTVPLPQPAKAHAEKSKMKNLEKILRKQAKTGLLTGSAVYLFFRIKRAGYTLSITKAYITAVIIAAGAACAVTAASAAAIVVYARNPTPVIPAAPATPKPSAAQSAPSADKPKPKPAIAWKLEIQPFSSAPEIRETAEIITSALKTRLSSDMRLPVFVTGSADADAPMILVGSVVKLDDKFILNARLVDTKTSRIVLLISEKSSAVEIKNLATAAADKIARELK